MPLCTQVVRAHGQAWGGGAQWSSLVVTFLVSEYIVEI